MPRSREKQAEYMRRWRAKRRAGQPTDIKHAACDLRFAELEGVIAQKNLEIGVLKQRAQQGNELVTELRSQLTVLTDELAAYKALDELEL